MSIESHLDSATREALGKAAYEADLKWYEGGSLGFTSWEQQRATTRERYRCIADAVIQVYQEKGGDTNVQ